MRPESESGHTTARRIIRTVVVGAGAAGIPLAARIAQDPRREVTLLEAGSDRPTPSEYLDGGTLLGALPGQAANWTYDAQLRPGQLASIARGRIIGGSTAINGGYFMRATPSDFETWAQAGGPSWSYAEALPLLRALENDLDFPEGNIHGIAGPMRVSRPAQTSAAARAFTAAARAMGFPDEFDKNGGRPPGVGPVPSNIVDGVRVNTGAAYLGSSPKAGERHRVNVIGDVRVLRVALHAAAAQGSGSDAARVVGVETDSGFFEADEVVLAAGAIATPQLLMLSGIGPRAHLTELGIETLSDLPVGESFSDHPNLALEWRTHRGVVEWDAGYSFPTSLNFDASMVDPELSARSHGDLEILLAAKPLGYLLTGVRSATETLHLLIALQGHTQSGRLRLVDADPWTPPRIEYRYLEAAEDRQRFRAGVRTAARLLSHPAFASIFAGFVDLEPSVLECDAALDTWIVEHLGTALHTCATAPMGRVADGSGRVYGVTGLRVADTSLLPAAPHRGPANTAVLIGEIIARSMLADD